jgi:hypothetical protein
MNISPVEEKEEIVDMPIVGPTKVKWAVRAVLKGTPGNEEEIHNLIFHFFHVKHPDFLTVLREAWELSGIAQQGIAMERSYTEEFDAYDAILKGVDPCYEFSFKQLLIEGVRHSLYNQQQAEEAAKQKEEEEEDASEEDDEPQDGFQVLLPELE